MFFRRKSKLVVETRSVDTQPFEIPQIEDVSLKKKYQKDHFVSPIFGTFVKDEIVIPNPTVRTGDLDLQLDGFRTKPKMTKETMKERYGSEYPEFDLVQGRNLKEALQAQGSRRQTSTQPLPKEVHPQPEKQEDVRPKTSLGDFFDKDTVKVAKKEVLDEVIEQKPEVPIESPRERPYVKPAKSYRKDYRLPGINLLSKPVEKVKDNGEWVQKQIEILDRTFEEFGVGELTFHAPSPSISLAQVSPTLLLISGVTV